MRTALAIVLFLTGSVLAQNTIGYSRSLKRYDRSQLGKISVMPTSLYTNCVLWQTFSRNDGTNYYDAASTKNGVSSISLWTNLVGGVVYCSSNNYVNLSTNAILGTVSQLTVSCWIWSELPAVQGTFLAFAGTTGTYDNWLQCQQGYPFKIRFGLRNSSGTRTYFDSGTTFSSNTWYLAAGTWDGSNMTLYVNATVSATGTLTGTINDTGKAHAIGVIQSLAANDFFKGRIDDVRFFNRALTSNEVVNLYNATKGDYGL
jgi:hypothetical protein